jgi:hypothetical protein
MSGIEERPFLDLLQFVVPIAMGFYSGMLWKDIGIPELNRN